MKPGGLERKWRSPVANLANGVSRRWLGSKQRFGSVCSFFSFFLVFNWPPEPEENQNPFDSQVPTKLLLMRHFSAPRPEVLLKSGEEKPQTPEEPICGMGDGAVWMDKKTAKNLLPCVFEKMLFLFPCWFVFPCWFTFPCWFSRESMTAGNVSISSRWMQP